MKKNLFFLLSDFENEEIVEKINHFFQYVIEYILNFFFQDEIELLDIISKIFTPNSNFYLKYGETEDEIDEVILKFYVKKINFFKG